MFQKLIASYAVPAILLAFAVAFLFLGSLLHRGAE